MLTTSVNEKLLVELKRRNLILLFPHYFVLIFTFFLLREKVPVFPFIIVGMSLLVRIFLMKEYLEGIKRRGLISFLFYFSLSMTGLGWGLLYWYSYQSLGFFSVKSLYCFGLIFTLMSGGITAYSSSLKSTLIYLPSLAVIPIYVFLSEPGEMTYLLALLLGLNLLCQSFHAVISNRYVTASLHSELSAIHQKQTLQEFMDAIPGLVIVIDKNQSFIMVNNHQEGSYQHLLEKKLGSLLLESELTCVIEDFFNSTLIEKVVEVKVGESGNEKWFMVNLKRIASPGLRIIAAIFPITDLVKAKNDLKIQEARSQYAAKLASLGELSAGIAHEVNNPLTIIDGAANLMKVLLKEAPLDVSSLDKAASKVMETTSRIAKIIKSLRTLSGDAEEEPFANVSFSSIIEPCVEISKAKLESLDIQLKVFPSEKDVALFGNEVQLSQVIMNLVSNAIDAVKMTSGDRWIEVRYRPSYEWLDILVIDSGEGVQADIQQKIMEPFFTTKDSSQGTGLGLSISKSIVQSHNGSLSLVVGEPNTTFRIRLPRMNPWLNFRKKSEEEETDVVLG